MASSAPPTRSISSITRGLPTAAPEVGQRSRPPPTARARLPRRRAQRPVRLDCADPGVSPQCGTALAPRRLRPARQIRAYKDFKRQLAAQLLVRDRELQAATGRPTSACSPASSSDRNRCSLNLFSTPSPGCAPSLGIALHRHCWPAHQRLHPASPPPRERERLDAGWRLPTAMRRRHADFKHKPAVLLLCQGRLWRMAPPRGTLTTAPGAAWTTARLGCELPFYSRSDATTWLKAIAGPSREQRRLVHRRELNHPASDQPPYCAGAGWRLPRQRGLGQ